jgi:serine/threonine-protein kinase SRPK3
LIGLDYLHRICGLIHTDLKLENILLCLKPEEVQKIVNSGHLGKKKDYLTNIESFRVLNGIDIGKSSESEIFNLNTE